MTPTTESATQNDFGSTRLRAEMDELLRKSARIDEEITGATAALDAARSELLADVGKKQIDFSTVAQSRMIALARARDALAEKIAAKKKEMEIAEASEKRQAQLDSLAQIAGAAANLLREYESLREEAGDELRKLADRLLDKFTSLSEHRQKFLERARGLADLTYRSYNSGGYGKADAEQTEAASALVNALEDSGVDLTAVRIPFDGSSSLIDRGYTLPSVEPFENMIAVMIQTVFEERQRATKSSPRRPM